MAAGLRGSACRSSSPVLTGQQSTSAPQQLMKEGAVLKSGPQENTNGWSAVLDEGGVDKTIHRW